MDDTPLIMVETDQDLVSVCKDLSVAPVLGIDTESDSMYHYREKCCLIQISDANIDVIVDPLKVDDLTPLGDLLAKPDMVKVFHGADYDVVSLQRDFGFRIHNLFDTMVASQFLDLPKIGLGDLAERFFGVELDKQYQRHDWSRRPLLPEHVEYARGDTHYLLALREILLRKLEIAGRVGPAEEEFALLELREWGGRGDEGEGWLRMKRIGHLDKDQRKVLRAVWRFRDGLAEKADRPPYKVFPERVLIQLAEQQPTDLDGLGRIARRTSNMVRRHGEGMIRAVVEGKASEEPVPAKSAKPRRDAIKPKSLRYSSREAEKLFLRLKTWRTSYVAKHKLPLVMTASNGQLKAVAGFRPHSIDELSGLPEIRAWQVKRIGVDLLAEVAAFEQRLERVKAERGEEEDRPRKPRPRRRRRRKPAGDAPPE